MNDLNKRKLVVTGAAGALGRAVCGELARRGAHVVALDLARAEPALARLKQELGCEYALIESGGVSDWEELKKSSWISDVSGAALIAGGWAGGTSFVEAPAEQLEEQLKLNLVSAATALRALLPPMLERGFGSAVVIGSKNAAQPELGANSAAYTVSKAALLALVQVLAAEVKAQGVRVNAVLPSVIDTQANRSAMPNADFSRWVKPESLAQTVR